MNAVAELALSIGLYVIDTLEGWSLLLIISVVAFDVWLGLKDRYVLYFNVLQSAGLFAGYLWTWYVFQQQDVAGPWAAAWVIAIWSVCTVPFHLGYLIYRLLTRKRAA